MAGSRFVWIMDGLVIAWRDLLRAVRQKSQFLGAIARPVIWLFLLGTGLRNGFTGLPPGVDLQQYTFPGIIMMNILFPGVMSGASIIWDREFGFLKEILVAPVARGSIIGGKILGGSVSAAAQGLIVLLLFPILNLDLTVRQILLTMTAMFLLAIAASSLGVLLASRIESIEGFGTIQNFLVMPLFVLSGALYPTTNIPEWLKYLIYFNPFTYGVELLRGITLGFNHFVWFDLGELALFIIIIWIITGLSFQKKGSKAV